MFGKKEKLLRKFRREFRAGIYAYIILCMLKKKDMHGYAIRKTFEIISNNRVVPSEGSLYDLLKKLQKLGLIESFWVEERGRLRKCYKITEIGEEILDELKKELGMLMEILEVVE